MDDRCFDRKAAQEWIAVIEGEHGRIRDADLYPYLRTWVERIDPREIADIGCGQGVCSEKIDLKGRSYTGIEPSSFLLERARQLHAEANKRFVSGNAYALPFRDGHFDAAFSIALWHLLEDKPKAAAELSRVLKDDGHFMIVGANPDFYDEWTKTYSRSERLGSRFEGYTRHSDGTETVDVLHLHSFDEIAASLKAAGLEILETAKFRTAISIQGRKFSGA